ncbi:glycosyltransferase family 1 protein [Moniliophthora roreri MCA 2997]|uniref:UDP-N-acetylglucosamine transferase subunit ALG13 n=2 Tax=Moniliophthora roreri TaxID=221103 RepID=V2XCG0_MONRO|nr:glycosyltransferase family 1 protein [Moniliophthora roreri MCA 2997]KAI3610515.1 glycosyltransferase family 1 protein [Moniliophthora roreri]
MLAFVTVGSTRFDALVNCVLSQSVLASLHNKGYTQLVIQCGNSDFDFCHLFDKVEDTFHLEKSGVTIECWKYKSSLQGEYERADLVISHAGSGTILDVLRLKRPLIVVPNSTLLDDHQQELATALQEMGYLKVADTMNLAAIIEHFDPKELQEFPPFDGTRFRDMLDEDVGFI